MYKEMADDELVFLIRHGNELAQTVLFDRYKLRSEILAKEFFKEFSMTGIQVDEFATIAFAAVGKAIDKCDNEPGGFFLFWKKIARNDMFSYVRSDHSLYSFSDVRISFDDMHYSDNERIQVHETISSPEDDKIEGLEEYLEKFIYSKDNGFTDDEALVAHLMFYRNYTPTEISKFVGWKKSKTFYVVDSVRNKISDYLKSGYFK